MDFDEDDELSEQPRKPPRFLPKSRFQPKSRANPAAVQPKPEPTKDGAAPPIPVKNEPEPIGSVSSPLEAKSEDQNASKSELPDDVDDSMDVDTWNESVRVDVDEDEEDCVVREIDVFFNPAPIDETTKLFVLQYPLRPCWRPYQSKDSVIEEIRLNPMQADVEIDLSYEEWEKHFNKGAPTASKFDKLTLSSKWMSFQRNASANGAPTGSETQSSKMRPFQKNANAVGVFTGSELHLIPVHAVRQLRPSMEYLNPDASKKKNVLEVAKKTKISKVESSENQKAMDIKDEPIILESCGPDTSLSSTYIRKLIAKVNSSVEFGMKPLEYLDSLCPRTAIDKMKPVAPSKRSLLLLPLEQRLRLLFTEGPPIHKFSALKHYAPDYPLEEDLIRALEQFAFVVQGYWVAKTKTRYPEKPGIQSSVKRQNFLAARDYALALFMQSPTIKSAHLNEGTRISTDMWADVLSELAHERPTCGDWKFKESPDEIFIKQHPKIMEESAKHGKKNEEEVQNYVKKKPTKAFASGKLSKIQISDQSPVLSASRPHTELRTISSEARKALPVALRKIFQANKVQSFKSIVQGLEHTTLFDQKGRKSEAYVAKGSAYGLQVPQDELLEVIGEVAVNIHGTFVLKLSAEHTELNDVRKVVIDLFVGKGLNAKVKKSEIMEAAKMQLKKEITNDEFRKVVSEFCETNGSAWVLKPTDGPSTSSAKK